jgi:hypothetical protein
MVLLLQRVLLLYGVYFIKKLITEWCCYYKEADYCMVLILQRGSLLYGVITKETHYCEVLLL